MMNLDDLIDIALNIELSTLDWFYCSLKALYLSKACSKYILNIKNYKTMYVIVQEYQMFSENQSLISLLIYYNVWEHLFWTLQIWQNLLLLIHLLHNEDDDNAT